MSGFPDYDRYDALGLAALVQRGEVQPAELVEEAIQRIEQVNPRLNAVVQKLYEDARRAAQGPLPSGAFQGVPFLLKDLNAAYAGAHLRAGSRLHADRVSEADSELTRRYKAAGLLIVGKTATPELGVLPVTESDLHGITRNPWDPGRTPGGSSGGSAAMVAAGAVPLAHGSDGGGSIRVPASCCGLFGLKPTRGRIPCGPDMSELFFGYSTDHVLSRSVRDSAAALDATAGPEPTSLHHAPPPERPFLEEVGRPPGRLRIAFTTEALLPGRTDPECARAAEDAARLCASLGHDVVEARPSFDGAAFARDFFLMFCTTVAGELDRVGGLRRRPVRLDEVEIGTWVMGLVGRTRSAGDFASARRRLLEAQRAMARFFVDHDALLTPTLGKPPLPVGALRPGGARERIGRLAARGGALQAMLRVRWLVDEVVERGFAFAPFTSIANVTGQPAMSVPLWWSADGLPIGTQLVGRFGADGQLLRLAAQLEEARPWAHRRPPIRANR